MLQVINPKLFYVPSQLEHEFVKQAVESYFDIATKKEILCIDTDISSYMTEIIHEATSLRLFNNKSFFRQLEDEEYYDFEMVSGEWYDGFLFDITTALDSYRLSHYLDNYSKYKNHPNKEVW
jgi:hypothetical protein